MIDKPVILNRNSPQYRELLFKSLCVHGDPAQEPFVLCNLCWLPVDPGEAWDISHIGVPAAHGGNVGGVAHRACNHADNHKNVIPFIAKTKRLYRNHHGIDEPGLTPQALPFGRKSKLKKKAQRADRSAKERESTALGFDGAAAGRAGMSPRDNLGLTAAHNGDPKGVRTFLRFVHQELWSMSVSGGLPKEIGDRVGSLAQEAQRIGEFVDGFNAGQAES